MPSPKAPLLQRLFASIMTFGLCVAVPVAVMLSLPVTRTTFTRLNGAVSATAVQMVYFVIPFRSETVAQVSGIDDYRVSGSLSRTTRSGPVNDPKRLESKSEGMAWLRIQGTGESVEVAVSPVDIDQVRRRVRDFLEDPDQRELRLLTVANWKLSVVVGALLSLLTLIYLGSLARGFLVLFGKSR